MLPDDPLFHLYESLLAGALTGLAARGEPLDTAGQLAVMYADATVEALAGKAAGALPSRAEDCPHGLCEGGHTPDCDAEAGGTPASGKGRCDNAGCDGMAEWGEKCPKCGRYLMPF